MVKQSWKNLGKAERNKSFQSDATAYLYGRDHCSLAVDLMQLTSHCGLTCRYVEEGASDLETEKGLVPDDINVPRTWP